MFVPQSLLTKLIKTAAVEVVKGLTSSTVASKAGKVLSDPDASPEEKSIAGSALSQARKRAEGKD